MKKKEIIYTAAALVSMFCWGGCSTVGFDTYDTAQNSVYFGMTNPNTSQKNVFVDTTVFSFGEFEKVTDTVIYIRVNALGGFFDTDRTFEYEVVDSLSTAIEGDIYTLPEKTGVIPANATCGYIPVRMHNTAALKKRAMFYLVLQLKPNENFNLDLKLEYVDKVNNNFVQLTRHYVGISNRIQQPESWYKVSGYFLDFSSDKYKLINELCHLVKEDWETMQFYTAEAYWVAVRNYLQERIDAGEPVMEEHPRTGRKQIMKVKGLTGI